MDYVDASHAGNRRPKSPKNAELPRKDGLSLRFGKVEGYDDRREDGPGVCKVGITNHKPQLTCDEWRYSDVWVKRTYTPDGKDGKHLGWYEKKTNRGWPGTAEGKINTAQGMAGDLVSNLDSAEKETVAGILTKTVSGAEVVEIRSVSTTSVILNACYDPQSEGFSIVPFACLGVGANFVSVTDNHVAAKLSYKLKAGLSCYVTPRVTAFVSGFYHKVLGEGEYDNIPVEHLKDDRSPEGRSQDYALARFRMSYTGAELGVRFAF